MQVLIGGEGGPQGGDGHFIYPDGTGQRVALHPVDIRLLSQNDTGLRPAQQLITAKAHHIHPGPDAVLHRRLVVDAVVLQLHQRTAAQILHHRQAGAAAQGHDVAQGQGLGKTHDAVVAGMHLQQRTGLLPDGPFIVREVRLIGGAYLPEMAAAQLHDIRHPEGAADLHQLPAGGDDLAPLGQGAEDQHDGGGVIVDHHGTLGAGEAAQQLFHMVVAASPMARLHVILQRGIAPCDVVYGVRRPVGQAATAQIGMENDAGGVDDRPQRRQGLPCRHPADPVAQLLQRGEGRHLAAEDGGAQLLQHGTDPLRHGGGSVVLPQVGHLRQII